MCLSDCVDVGGVRLVELIFDGVEGFDWPTCAKVLFSGVFIDALTCFAVLTWNESLNFLDGLGGDLGLLLVTLKCGEDCFNLKEQQWECGER
jgi:hypothetical protein